MKKNILIALTFILILGFASCSFYQETSNIDNSESTTIPEISREIVNNKIDSKEIKEFYQSAVGGDGLVTVKYPFNMFYNEISSIYVEYVGYETYNEWIDTFMDEFEQNKERSAYEQLFDPYIGSNIEKFIKHFEIEKEIFIELNDEAIKRAKEAGLIGETYEQGEIFAYTIQQIDALYSGDVDELFAAFPNPHAILHNQKVYTPGWFITHTAEDYAREGIPLEKIDAACTKYSNDGYPSYRDTIAADLQTYAASSAAASSAKN